METIGSEVMKKIKCAVKAKLLEIGAYVDEELPDYIMVMIANRRSKAQMKSDLSLFLGNHTEVFTEWLHLVLNKLESFSINTASERAKESDERSDRTVHRTQKSEKPQEKQTNEVTSKSSHSEKDKDKYKPKENENSRALSSSGRSSRTQSNNPKMKKDYTPTPIVAYGQIKNTEETYQAEEVDDDCLNIRDEMDTEFHNEEQQTTNIKSSHHTSNESSSSKNKRRLISAEEKSKKKPCREETRTACRVGSVVHPIFNQAIQSLEQEKKKSEDTDTDKKNGVPSIVRVTARPRLPANMQANKSLILKAVAEAQKSVTSLPPKVLDIEKKPVTELFTRKYREKIAERSNQIAVTVSNINETPMEIETESPQILEEMEQTIPENPVQPEVETQFIVTLDGLNVDMGEPFEEEIEEEEEEEIIQGSLNRDLTVATKSSNIKSRLFRRRSTGSDIGVKQALERCKYWPHCRQGERCTYHHPSIPCKSFPNCTFGENCLFIHPNCKFDTSCTRKNCPYAHTSVRITATIAPVKATAPVINGKTICKYFPLCSNVNCPFFHPPPCKFGSLCTKAGCTFYHPKNVPSQDKLKWIATK